MSRKMFEKVAGAFFLVAVITADYLFDITAVMRVSGVACIVTGVTVTFSKSIPVGIEGRPPLFFLRGGGALISGAAMAILGIVILLFPKQTACLLGGAEC